MAPFIWHPTHIVLLLIYMSVDAEQTKKVQSRSIMQAK